MSGNKRPGYNSKDLNQRTPCCTLMAEHLSLNQIQAQNVHEQLIFCKPGGKQEQNGSKALNKTGNYTLVQPLQKHSSGENNYNACYCYNDYCGYYALCSAVQITQLKTIMLPGLIN